MQATSEIFLDNEYEAFSRIVLQRMQMLSIIRMVPTCKSIRRVDSSPFVWHRKKLWRKNYLFENALADSAAGLDIRFSKTEETIWIR